MAWEFAAPADCFPDLYGQHEVPDLDIERLSVFAQSLRGLALNPQDQLGVPFIATRLDGLKYVIGPDGKQLPASGFDDYRYTEVADDILYGRTTEFSGYLRFSSRLASGAKEVYVPNPDRRDSLTHEPSVDDLVEDKTGKRIQVVLSWVNEFFPNGKVGKINVQKRYYFLGEDDSCPTTSVLCLTVYGSSIIPQSLVFDTTFEEPEVFNAIEHDFKDFTTPVTMEDINRIGRRVNRNVGDYLTLRASLRKQKLGSGILRLIRRKPAYDQRTIGTIFLEQLVRDSHEHLEDDPADGFGDGDFSILL
jgi:hypothetical protein